MFFGNFAVGPKSIARHQLSVTLYVTIWHLAGLPRDGGVEAALKNTSSTDKRFMIFAGWMYAKRERRRTPPNSQVRQLDSTCNLIFTVVGTAQTWTLLSYSLRCDDAFIPNHRFHQKRRPHGSPNPEKRPFFQRVVHEFISEGAHSLSLYFFFFSFLRLNFDENAKNTRRSIHEPM